MRVEDNDFVSLEGKFMDLRYIGILGEFRGFVRDVLEVFGDVLGFDKMVCFRSSS